MKNALLCFIAILCIAPLCPAQESPQWHLPDGAIKRFGKGTAKDIAYSPDGTKLAVATQIGIWIYDADTAEPLNLLTDGASSFRTVAFSPDGKTLASDIKGNYLCLWDVETGRQVRVFGYHTHFDIYRIAFSPDGKKIASAGSGDTIRLWDVQTGTQLHVIRWHFQTITSLAFSPDSQTLATPSSPNRICLWDTNDGSCLRTFSGHTEPVYRVAFHPAGKTIASSSGDKTVRFWDVETGEQIGRPLTRYTEYVSALAFSPDGNTVAIANSDNKIYLWRFADLVLRRTLSASNVTAHNDTITRLAFSPDSHRLASLSRDGDIRSWNILTGWQRRPRITGHFAGAFWGVTFSPDGQTIASSWWDEVIRLWDADTGSMKGELIGHTDETEAVAFSPDSTMIASGSKDNTLRLWDVNTQTLLQTFTTLLNDVQSDDQSVEIRRSISHIQFSADGKTVACLISYGSQHVVDKHTYISLFDVAAGTELHTIQAYNAPSTATPQNNNVIYPTHHTEPVRSIAFTPDGSMIVSSSGDKTFRLWDVKTGRHLRVLIEDAGWATDLTFSPDGNILAFVSNRKNIHLWHMQANMLTYTLSDSDTSFRDLAFHPDGNVLAAAGDENTIQLWDVNYGMLLHTLGEYRNDVFFPNYYYLLAFHPDGNTLMGAASNDTVVFWDTTNLVPLNTTVALSPATLVSPGIGNRLTLSINITAGQDVMGYQSTLNYDSTALRYVQSTNADYLRNTAYVLDPIVEDGSVRVAATTFGEVSAGNGTLATITFEVIEPKASTVSLSDVILTDTAGNSTKPIIDGATEITTPIFVPEDVNQDGVVNLLDLTFVAANFGRTGKNPADVNKDGVVNIVDLALVAGAIGSNGAAAPSTFSSDVPPRATVETWLRIAQQHDLTDPAFRRGVLFLQNLLTSITPTQTALLPNYPNPFNPETWIPYQLAAPADVHIYIYALDGKLVRSMTLGHQPIGSYTDRTRAAYWDGRNARGESVASGVYVYVMQAGDYRATRRMIIAK